MNTIVFIAFFIIIATFAYAGYLAAPWVPMRKNDIARILKAIDIQKKSIFIDLGCGDGRMVAAAAKRGAQAIGYEISLFPYFFAKMRELKFRNKNKYNIRYKNFWNVNLAQADIVFFFLTPKIYPKIKRKLEKELKPGAQVISYVWPIDGWKESNIYSSDNSLPIYVYQR